MSVNTLYNIDTDLWDSFKQEEPNTVNETKDSDDEYGLYCYHCHSDNLVTENSIVTCRSCGTINNNILDSNAEWRFYGCDDSKLSDPNRCGLPTNELLPESSLGSTIGFRYGESYEMKKIRNYHTWNAMPYKERSLYGVFDAIQIRAINNGIPACIIQEAKILYKKISETKISRGSNRKGIIASCIYKACKLKNVPRSAKEIAEIFQLNITHMTKGCKKFDEIMNYNKAHSTNENTTGATSQDFIQRFCSKLNIGNEVYNICKYVCVEAENWALVSENTPPSIAAGSIYLVCSLLNIAISKKEISVSCKISEVTISKCYKKLLRYCRYLFPEYIVKKLWPGEIIKKQQTPMIEKK
jgi:transcription initiation factor TFIIB